MSRGVVGNEQSSGHAPPVEWSRLLEEAVSRPGVIASAYHRFWNYSVGNQLLAWFQCLQRNLEIGPINTFLGWQDCGRHVKKGEKALVLCMPVQCKVRMHKQSEQGETEHDADDAKAAETCSTTVTRFVYRPHWFVLAQTEGTEYVPTDLPEWWEDWALSALGIERVPFAHPNGNVQGYACRRQVAVSSIAFAPHRTLFHEIAHVVLGHTLEIERMEDEECTPRSIREAEAEGVALICCESLGLPGAEFSRGYIQHWLSGESISERSAQRIFKAADQVLRLGHPVAQATA